MTRLPRLVIIAITALLVAFPVSALGEQAFVPNLYQELHWRMIGPYRGGRTRAVAGVAGQPNVFYIGATNGGVWKSNDYGRTWNPIFDSQPTQSIGAIALAPSDPDIIYVASGEGLHRPDLSVGDGIYRSADAGKTWAHLGLRDGQQIPAVAVDPRDPNRLFAAVLGHPYGPNNERGIYRSSDGGKTWDRILGKDADTGGADVAIDPSNPDVVYASLWEGRLGPWEDDNDYEGTRGGLFKSTDGGTTWHQLTRGLPDNLTHIHIALCASETNRLYIVASSTEKSEYATDKGVGVFRSDDGGENWRRATTDPRPAMLIGGGDLPIVRVDPQNADVLYSTGIVTVRSTDGGRTWISLRGAPGGDDYQNLWINPKDSKIILLVADQGAVITVNGGETWSSWYNQPTAQIYHVAVTNTFPYKVCGGQQESGSVCISSRGNDGAITFRDWHPVGVIEYGYAAPDPLDPDIIYGAGRNEVSKFHWSTGQVQNVTPIPIRGEYRAERTEPILFSPHDPHTLYYAANVLFKTTDAGNSWQTISPDLTRQPSGVPASLGQMAAKDDKADKKRGAIYSLSPSFKTMATLWAGTDDGFIWITRNGGKNWQNITPPELTPWSKVTQLSASHFDDVTAYASVSRFRIDDLRPYIYRTHDGGKTWQSIAAGLPDNAPVDTVREDPVRKGMLFAGTENAVWVSFDDGDHWQSLQLNLPHTSMRDLWVHHGDLIVGTHGRGFWILDNIAPLRELNEQMAMSSAYLFKPSETYRVRASTYTDTPMPPDEPAAANPPEGASIDYYVGKPSQGPVTIEILDTGGKVIRKYASNDDIKPTVEELGKHLIPLYWIRMPKRPSAEAGMHRWQWNLRYPAPISLEHEYPISAVVHDTPREPLGPTVPPGRYSVRLTVDGKTFTQPLVIRMDPRVKTSQLGLEAQFQTAKNLASMLTAGSQAVLQAQFVDDQLKHVSASGVADAVRALQTRLTPVLSDKAKPGLTQVSGDARTLYGVVTRADTAPTATQTAAAAKVEHDFADVMKRWKEIRTTDVPALNAKLRAAGATEIHIEENPLPNDIEIGADKE